MQQTNYNIQINREIKELMENRDEPVSLQDWIHVITKAAEENLTPISEEQRKDYIKKETWNWIVERDTLVEEKRNPGNRTNKRLRNKYT